jgi:hypothetical protein
LILLDECEITMQKSPKEDLVQVEGNRGSTEQRHYSNQLTLLLKWEGVKSFKLHFQKKENHVVLLRSRQKVREGRQEFEF